MISNHSIQNFTSYETTRSLSSLGQESCQSYVTLPDTDINMTAVEHSILIKRHKEKCNVLKEILSSEKKYITDIKEIVEGYYEEISKSYSDNKEFIYHIFSNIKEIFEFTKVFYTLLESASTKDETAIALCFIRKHKTFSKLYSTYCQNYKIAHSTTERLEKDNSIGKIIQKVRNKYGHSLKMATYLQLPVLRITKYHLLLQRYLKLQEKDTIAYKHVLEALELMRQVNDQINQDMPELDDSKVASNLTTLNLTSLFGSVIKQGDLITTDNNESHHVVVFQTMFLIRDSDSTSKIINTITNDSLGFSPVTINSGFKNWKKCFSVIDYNQNKSDNIFQYTFKASSCEEKKSWQSAILSCMLNGYGKKISENVKRKVMRMDHDQDSESQTTKYESLRMKIPNFKRIKDFRYSLKNEIKNTSCQNFDYLDTNNYSSLDPNATAPLPSLSIEELNSKRRVSEPFKSPLFNKPGKKCNLENNSNPSKSENTIQNMLKKFYKSSKYNKKKLNFSDENNSFMSESAIFDSTLNASNKDDIKKKTSIEIKLNDFEIIYQHLDTSYDISSHHLDESTVSKFEKFINKKIASSSENNIDFKDPVVSQKFPSKQTSDILNKKIVVDNEQEQNKSIYQSSLSSKSSINSEEGYFSNHDSSISTLINEIQINENNNCPSPVNSYKFSTPELQRKHSDISSYSGNNIIHIEIINNFEGSKLDSEPNSLFNSSFSGNKTHLDCRMVDDTLRLKENKVILNAGNFEMSNFNKMQMFKYKKNTLSRSRFKKKDLSDLRLNAFINDKSIALASLKLDQESLNYEKFSRNLNTSSASLYDNTQEMPLDLDPPPDLSLNESSVNNSSYITCLENTYENCASKCKSLGSLIEQNKKSNISFSKQTDASKKSRINVKDLIMKFEKHKRIALLNETVS